MKDLLVAFLFFELIFFVPRLEASENSAAIKGRELYLSYGCAACHGKSADGRGLVTPKNMSPTDFHNPKLYRHGSTKAEIINSIKFGIKENGSVMPAFNHLPQAELDAIAAYLESLQKTSPSQTAEDSNIVVRDAWVRLMPPSRPNSAAYMTIENNTSQDKVLTAVSSDLVRTVEMHTMEHSDGMMKMHKINEIRIPAGGTIELKRGGLHLMLFGIREPLEKGNNIPFVLTFQDGSSVTVDAVVRESTE